MIHPLILSTTLKESFHTTLFAKTLGVPFSQADNEDEDVEMFAVGIVHWFD